MKFCRENETVEGGISVLRRKEMVCGLFVQRRNWNCGFRCEIERMVLWCRGLRSRGFV